MELPEPNQHIQNTGNTEQRLEANSTYAFPPVIPLCRFHFPPVFTVLPITHKVFLKNKNTFR
jgi:hypothetical protein